MAILVSCRKYNSKLPCALVSDPPDQVFTDMFINLLFVMCDLSSRTVVYIAFTFALALQCHKIPGVHSLVKSVSG